MAIAFENAIAQARLAKRTDRPDVIAHSFGTRLFSLLLEDEGFADLTFGRIITAGGIIHPDFEWGRHVNSGRIEAVLTMWVRRTAQGPSHTTPFQAPAQAEGLATPLQLSTASETVASAIRTFSNQ